MVFGRSRGPPLRTKLTVPVEASSLELTLFPFDLPTSPTLQLSTASAIDPSGGPGFYPYRITGGVTGIGIFRSTAAWFVMRCLEPCCHT